jgi:hypothetical protein
MLFTSTARADGAYGRFDGDLALAAEAGASASSEGAGLAVRLTASYLTMAGIYAEYTEGFGRAHQAVARRISGGVDIRPLFLARFINDRETGPAALDLWLDSLGVGLGAYHAWRNAGHCAEPAFGATADTCRDHGLELLGHMGLPLLLRANSPIIALRAGVRWSLSTLPDGSRPDPQPVGILTIGYQHLFTTGVLQKRR